MKRVHLIILTRNHWHLTQTCLTSLQTLTYPNHQTVVVDNGSTDETLANLARDFPTLPVIANGENLGFAAGCNVGIRHALAEGTDYVLLLNNDTVAPPNLLDTLMAEAGRLPDAGILTPALHYLDKPEQLWFAGSRRHPLTLESVDFGPVGPRRHTEADRQHVVDYIFGTAMLLPRNVLEKVGLLDESYFMYYEDMDYCLRVQAAGYQLYYLPQVSVGHGVSASTESTSAFRYYHKARSSVIFFHGHARGWRRWLILVYRSLSAMRTTFRLLRLRQPDALHAHWRGLRDGLAHLRAGPTP